MKLEDVQFAKQSLEAKGVYPSGSAILKEIGRGSKRDAVHWMRVLNGKQQTKELDLSPEEPSGGARAHVLGCDTPAARDRLKTMGIRQRRVLEFLLENTQERRGEIYTYEALKEVMGDGDLTQRQLMHVLRTPRAFLFDFYQVWFEAIPLKGLYSPTETGKLPILAKRRRTIHNMSTKSTRLAATIKPQHLSRTDQRAYIAESSIPTAVAIATDPKTVAMIETQNHAQPIIIDLKPYEDLFRIFRESS